MRHHAIRRAGALFAALALVLTACSEDTPSSAGGTTSTTAGDVAEHSQSTAIDVGDTGDATESDGEVIDISVDGGTVTGGGRTKISLGATVILRITSDVADEIHLHGYDLTVDVRAGETAELTFEATIPGVFEAEFHHAGLPLVELEIS